MSPPVLSSAFADRISDWQRREGRQSLPWQVDRDPYRIWVSEVMLQQTQVTTVIPYYTRFLLRFPDVRVLAAASVDEVLRHWSGLGYYARGRNLHRAAMDIVSRFDSNLPRTADQWVTLPGIGRSTAAAITVFAYGVRAAILDGNVKRVLARAFAIEGWPGAPTVERRLWDLAEQLLPPDGIEAYTQGLMDLGSLVCVRGTPDCRRCPVNDDCIARRMHATQRLPSPRPKVALPHRTAQFLILEREGQVLLERRPSSGIWGGLWCLPQIDGEEDPRAATKERFGVEAESIDPVPPFDHTFTHFRLTLRPWRLQVMAAPVLPADSDVLWVSSKQALDLGVPAPIRSLLSRLTALQEGSLPLNPA